MKALHLISTHAPLAGRDGGLVLIHPAHTISTHAPLAGRDHCGSHQPCCGTYFNPRAPCGARPLAIRLLLPRANISTHAPLAGRDGASLTTVADAIRISTHAPLAGRDCGGHRQKHDGAGISTHAPLAGRDMWPAGKAAGARNFNPRAPCGARLFTFVGVSVTVTFQPTRPLRGATFLRLLKPGEFCISTHAPLAGRDERYGVEIEE